MIALGFLIGATIGLGLWEVVFLFRIKRDLHEVRLEFTILRDRLDSITGDLTSLHVATAKLSAQLAELSQMLENQPR